MSDDAVSDDALVLVLNAGSSSLKHELREPGGVVLDSGTVQRIGVAGGPGDHAAALSTVLDLLESNHPGALARLVVVGHRVVHGGARFSAATLVDDDVERDIDELSALAPLHNPPQLAGIRAMRQRLPQVPQVAVFDTAFHTTIPDAAALYALPRALAERLRIRRYGFHGISVQYVVRTAAERLRVPVDEVRLVVCHIGNGVSVTAVRDGVSVDTSMGMTPLAGAVMGTRSGDVDPSVLAYLHRQEGTGLEDIDALLNRESGLRGLCGASDLREVHALIAGGSGRERAAQARTALDVYTHRLRAYVSSSLGEVPGVHAVVLTGGVGENDAVVQEEMTAPLAHLGVGTSVEVMVVATDEEGEIARQCLELVGA